MKNYYEILEVNKKASKEVISKVYKILAKKYHPDTTTCDKQVAEEKFKQISEAYEILSDEEKRRQYDSELEAQENQLKDSTVPIEDFIALKDYCKELENTINQYSSTINNSNNINYSNNANYANNVDYNNYNQYNEAQRQAEAQAYQDAINKAYHDTYINNLKNMGYKIRYRQTFKQKLKNLFALIITFLIVFVVFYILWHIPSVQEKIKDFFLFPL